LRASNRVSPSSCMYRQHIVCNDKQAAHHPCQHAPHTALTWTPCHVAHTIIHTCTVQVM
jgi:hypothetical protein